MPALTRSAARGTAARLTRRLLDEGHTRPSSSVEHHAEGARGRRRGRGRSCPRRPAGVVEVHQGGEVEVGEHVTVDDQAALVDARPPGPRSAWRRRCRAAAARWRSASRTPQEWPSGNSDEERLVAGSRATARPRSIAVRGEVREHPLDHGHLDDRQHLLRNGEVSGRRRVPSPPTSTTALTARRAGGVPRAGWWRWGRPEAVVVALGSAGTASALASGGERHAGRQRHVGWERDAGRQRRRRARRRSACRAGRPSSAWGCRRRLGHEGDGDQLPSSVNRMSDGLPGTIVAPRRRGHASTRSWS